MEDPSQQSDPLGKPQDTSPEHLTLYCIIITVIYSVQITICVVCVSVRFFHFKSVAKSNRRMIFRPSYVSKLLLHGLIVMALILALTSYVWPSDTESKTEQWIRIFMVCGQIVCWSISCYMLRFELQRNLGHVWYMHYLFVWLSVAVYCGDFTYTLMSTKTFDENRKLDVT